MSQTLNDDLTHRVIDCVREVHNQTGPGLPKDVYEACLAVELAAADLPFETGRVLKAVYDGRELDYRCETDLIVAGTLVVQVEAVDAIGLIHEQKLRTCLWMGGYKSGLLLNFDVEDMEDGISRIVPEAVHNGSVGQDVFEDPDLGTPF